MPAFWNALYQSERQAQEVGDAWIRHILGREDG